MDCSPFAFEKDKPLLMMLESMVISDLVTSGFGVGSMGSSPPPLQADKQSKIANIAHPIILNVFI
jgi:hypothetical protein